jgi:hypothetical protein
MATPGQPTLYTPEYCELAHNYCLLGAINETLADFFGVTRRTIQNWIATHADFADAVYRGRAVADAVVVRALFERAKGFSHQVTHTTLEIRAKKIRTDRLLLRFEKALLPVTVIFDPCNGTQKFALLRAEPTGRERGDESRRHAGN